MNAILFVGFVLPFIILMWGFTIFMGWAFYKWWVGETEDLF